MRDAFVQGVLAEIEIRTLPEKTHAPPLFSAIFLGTNVENSWFDYFIREAADRLKNEDAFAAIWNAEQVAYATELLREVTAQLDRLERIVGVPLRTGQASVAKFAAAIRRRPAELLIARYRVIPYFDRGDLLQGALAWARSTEIPTPQDRLYVAPGGFGKTRFAIEMLLALAAEGWHATFVSSRDLIPHPGRWTDLMAQDEAVGTFVVLDYAESQIALLKAGRQCRGGFNRRCPRRSAVVALARSPEGWWEGTRSDAGMPLVFDPDPIRLIERPLEEAERAEFFDAGTAAFREELAAAGLATPEVPPPDIAGQAYDRPLTVAMAAFLKARGIVPEPVESVFHRVFIEERRHWQRALERRGRQRPGGGVAASRRCTGHPVKGAIRDGARALIAADSRAAKYDQRARDDCLATLERIGRDHRRKRDDISALDRTGPAGRARRDGGAGSGHRRPDRRHLFDSARRCAAASPGCR